MKQQGMGGRPRNDPIAVVPQRAARSLLVCALMCAQSLPTSRAKPVRPADVANSSAAKLRVALSDLNDCGADDSQVSNGEMCRCPTASALGDAVVWNDQGVGCCHILCQNLGTGCSRGGVAGNSNRKTYCNRGAWDSNTQILLSSCETPMPGTGQIICECGVTPAPAPGTYSCSTEAWQRPTDQAGSF